MDHIRILEKLIVEFYDPYISSQRRKEIDKTLQTYEWTPVPWKECMQYVERNENILVSSFCLKMIESLISKHWNKLSVDNKTMLHGSLSGYLLRCQTDIPLSIKKHLMKLLAIIARKEWSTVGISFITDIMNMTLSDDVQMVLFGLNFLLIASEELIEPRDILCSAKKIEIRHHFESNIPRIFYLLNGTFLKYKGIAVEEQIYEILLQIYSQLFSWVPLSDVYTIDLLSPIYEGTMHANHKIRMLALTALNEVLYKNCVPSKNIPLITSICHKLNEILLEISESNTEAVEDEYISKILEAVSLILSLHWHRIESNMEPSDIISFVSSFYKLTFYTINRQSYRICLEIWCNFLEYLTMRDVIHKQQYENLLNTLLEEIIRKLYTEFSLHENPETTQEEEEELVTLFNQHMNIIDMIIELTPDRAFTLIVNLWNRTKFIYIQAWTGGENIDVCSVDEKEILGALYAFRICTQILTSLHSKSPDSLKTAITKNLIDAVTFGASEYIKSGHNNRNPLYRHFIKVYCTLLKATPVWITNEKFENDVIITNIFALMLPFITNSTNIFVHEELQVAIAELLSSLTVHITQTNLMRPLFVDPTFKYLPAVARKHLQCALCHWVCVCKNESYEERVKFLRNFFEMVAPNKLVDLEYLSNILQNCRVTKSEGKELLFKALEFLEAVSTFFKIYDPNLKRLQIMHENFSSFVLCYQPWLEYVTHQFPFNFAKQSQLCESSLIFLLEVVRVFQNNVKSDFLDKMLLTFESCFINLTVQNAYGQEFEKMLMIFTLLMQHPGHTYNEHIPKILRVAQKIFFYSREKKTHVSYSEDNVDVEFFKLLCCILINKWPYFNTISRSLIGTELSQPYQEVDAILLRILESFGEPDINIYRSNLRCMEEMNTKWNFYEKEIFRSKHLSSMLNTLLITLIDGKHKLLTDEILSAVFHMAAVNFEMFYNNYIPLLLANTNGLTQHQIHTLRNNFRPETDLPSFIQAVSHLINDVRSYQIENGC